MSNSSPVGVMNRVRGVVARSPLRRLLLHPRVRPMLGAVASLRFVPAARVVDRPAAFVVNELLGRGTRTYRLGQSGGPLVIRHGEGALELLDDIFVQQTYDPPEDLVGLIGDMPRILDVGANVGAFCAFAHARWPKSPIKAIEADPDNVVALRRYVDLDDGASIEVIEAAASTSEEPVRFLSGLGSSSAIHPDGEPIRAIDLLAMLSDVDFVKLDIERGEWPILADPRLAQGGALVMVMEYHRRWVDDTDALDVATRLLTEAGFDVGHVRPNYWGHGTLWAWRTAEPDGE